MIEGVAVISAHERVLFSNRAFSRILGLEGATIEAARWSKWCGNRTCWR